MTEQVEKQVYPGNLINLPSKGLLYEPDNPLSKGVVEMKFMTAKEENILTTESYINNKTVIDKLIQSLIVAPKFDYNTLLIGDKDALIIGSRIYGYGEMYDITVKTPSGNNQKVSINLTELPEKEVDEKLFENGNSFSFKCPISQNQLIFKLLTLADQKAIDDNLKKYRKAGSADTQITSRLIQMIQSIDGNSDPMYIKLFVENELRAPDSRAFREYVASIQPGVNMEIELVDEATGEPFRTTITIEPDFFWPDSGV